MHVSDFFIYRGSYTYGGGGCGCCCNKKGDLLPMLAALAAAVFFIQQIIMMGGRRKRKRRKRHLYWEEDLPRSIYDDGKFPKGITFLVTNTKMYSHHGIPNNMYLKYTSMQIKPGVP